jgi:hypothetical protein
VNHLSKRGARDVVFDSFLPILERHPAATQAASSRGR